MGVSNGHEFDLHRREAVGWGPASAGIPAHLWGRSAPGWLFGRSTKTLILDLRPLTSPPNDAGVTAKTGHGQHFNGNGYESVETGCGRLATGGIVGHAGGYKLVVQCTAFPSCNDPRFREGTSAGRTRKSLWLAEENGL